MLRSIFATAIAAALTVAVMQPASAGIKENGVEMNGRTWQGIEMNGIQKNGVESAAGGAILLSLELPPSTH